MEMELLAEGDHRREMALLSERVECLGLRLNQHHEENMNMHRGQAGVKGRLDNVMSMCVEQDMVTKSALEDLRAELSKKSGMAEMDHTNKRMQALAEENRMLRVGQESMLARLSNLEKVSETVSDLNDRLKRATGDFEDTSMALSGEMGEVKGKVENLTARQTSLERKAGDSVQSLRSDLDTAVSNLSSRTETLVSSRCSNLESKLSAKVDTVVFETKQWRSENSQVLSCMEEREVESEKAIQKLTFSLESALTEGLQQQQQDLRALAREVEDQATAKKEMAQENRQELSQLAEVTTGLSEQYAGLILDATQRNEMFGDVMRAMETRVVKTENSLTQWRSLIDTALEDLRNQGVNLMQDRISGTLASIEQLVAEREKQRTAIQKLEDDAKVTASSLGQLDENFNISLSEVRETQSKMGQELATCNSRLESTKGDSENAYLRMAKCLIDVENLVKQTGREMQDAQNRTCSDLSELTRTVEFINTSKFPSWEARLTNELASLRPVANMAADVAQLKESADGYAGRNELLTVQQETQRLAALHKEIKLAAERSEMMARTLQTSMEEHRDTVNVSISTCEATTGELTTTFAQTLARLDPTVKRLDSQMSLSQRTAEATQQNIERLESSLQETGSEIVELHSRTGSIEGRIDTFMSRPLASEQSLKALQAQTDSSITTLQRDLNTMETHQQEQLERHMEDTNKKTKVMGSAMLELRQKVENVVANVEDESSRTENSFRELRTQLEESTDSLGRRVDANANDIRNLKASTHKFEVQISDTKAVGQTMNEMKERFGRTLEELEGSTTGIATELSGLKTRVVRTERQVRENITKDVTELADKVEMKFVQIEDRTNRLSSELGSQVDAITHATAEYRKGNDEEKKDLRDTMRQILQKQEAAESMSGFGMRMVTEVKENFDRFETEQKELTKKSREDIDRRHANTVKEYEAKLEQIFQQEKVEGQIRQVSARHVKDLEEQIRELSKQRHKDSPSASAPVAPAAPIGTAQPAPVAPILGPRPVAGDSGSIMSSVSSRADKPAVGMDCKDTPEGLQVYHVKTGGPADVAGVVIGDIITQIDGNAVATRGVYKGFIKRRKPSDSVVHTVRRANGESAELTIVMGAARAR